MYVCARTVVFSTCYVLLAVKLVKRVNLKHNFIPCETVRWVNNTKEVVLVFYSLYTSIFGVYEYCVDCWACLMFAGKRIVSGGDNRSTQVRKVPSVNWKQQQQRQEPHTKSQHCFNNETPCTCTCEYYNETESCSIVIICCCFFFRWCCWLFFHCTSLHINL